MAKQDRVQILRTLVRGLVAGILTIGMAVLLYTTMGVSILSAVLFAVACFVINILTSYV